MQNNEAPTGRNTLRMGVRSTHAKKIQKIEPQDELQRGDKQYKTKSLDMIFKPMVMLFKLFIMLMKLIVISNQTHGNGIQALHYAYEAHRCI